jgi:hypothetical protein
MVWIALALLVVQLPWIIFWMLWQRNVLEDGLIKRPFPELFIHIGIAVPSILAIGASVLHCQREYRLYASLRNCKLCPELSYCSWCVSNQRQACTHRLRQRAPIPRSTSRWLAKRSECRSRSTRGRKIPRRVAPSGYLSRHSLQPNGFESKTEMPLRRSRLRGWRRTSSACERVGSRPDFNNRNR